MPPEELLEEPPEELLEELLEEPPEELPPEEPLPLPPPVQDPCEVQGWPLPAGPLLEAGSLPWVHQLAR
jgi:hypothetical protein